MASWTSSIHEPHPHVRQYPLDLDLPFERYEHRHLAARDILVHRIMSKLLFPGSKGLAQVYDSHRRMENGLHNFGHIKQYDRILAKDLELLRKMLITCSVTDVLYEPFIRPMTIVMSAETGIAGPRAPVTFLDLVRHDDAHIQMTVAEEILDLIRRHYFESDNPSTRLWLHATQPPMPSSYHTLPNLPQPEKTHAASAQQRKKRDEYNRSQDEKKWYIEDTEHLKSFQKNTQTAHSLSLYDGGALLPSLRQPLLSSRVSRIKHATRSIERGAYAVLSPEEHRQVIKDNIFPLPGADAPRPMLHLPAWRRWIQRQLWFRDIDYVPPVDFASGRTGRGMDRDGIWSTGRWDDEDGERGRMARRGRRRASSEPPPNTFTSARLPWGLHQPREMLIFPKMTLATATRRSRRRSLSRTRIAEMFDWDTVLRAQPNEERPPGQLQKPHQESPREQPLGPPQEQPWGELSPCPPIDDKPACAHKLEQRLESLRGYRSDNFDWDDFSGMFDDVWTSLPKKVLPVKACCHSTGAGSCANCTSMGHATSKCSKPCGFCGAPSPNTLYYAGFIPGRILSRVAEDMTQPKFQHGKLHMASECTVAKHNRCKCSPFPQYHVATKCPVLCSRNCGNDHPPGHFKHKNAMTCRARCCMCGTKGHSGQQCKSKRCRCGGAHLGQDCRWQVECRVKGCDRFLCGVHCVGCGISRGGELQEGVSFCGGRCPSCLSETEDRTVDNVSVGDYDNDDEKGAKPRDGRNSQRQQNASNRGKRKNIRKIRDPEEKKKKEKEEVPWYAPLQPRTRPIVTSKSGKRTTWRK